MLGDRAEGCGRIDKWELVGETPRESCWAPRRAGGEADENNLRMQRFKCYPSKTLSNFLGPVC